MSHTPTVSIGLPVYNGQNYLAQALTSVLAQSYTDFELIICDNASTDATQAICERFAKQDQRIRYIRHSENGGLIWNFNHTFSFARGKYFKWSAHDDLLHPAFLADCVKQLDADENFVACCPATEVIDVHGCLLLEPNQPQTRRQDPLGTTRLNDPPGNMRGLEHPWTCKRYCGVVIKSTRCYEEFGLIRAQAIRDSSLRGYYAGSEKVFLAELAIIGKIKTLPKTRMYMRIHDERLSAKGTLQDRHQLYLAPTQNKKKKRMPPQLRCAWGYGAIIWKHPMRMHERLGCMVAFLRFLLQIRKWRAIIGITLLGREPAITADTLQRGENIAEQLGVDTADYQSAMENGSPTAPTNQPKAKTPQSNLNPKLSAFPR